jgi:hypothetical protein
MITEIIVAIISGAAREILACAFSDNYPKLAPAAREVFWAQTRGG